MLYRDFSVKNINEFIVDKNAIKQSIENILLTEKSSLPGKPNFGCGLKHFLFENLDYILINSMRSEITRALNNYEPRIKVENINIYQQQEFNKLIIEIQYYYTNVRTSDYETFQLILKA